MRSMQRWSMVLIAAGCLCSPALAAEGIRWQTDLPAAQRLAAQTNRLVLVHFWATWCTYCEPLEREVFNQAEVARALDVSYVPVKLNFDKHRDVADKYGVRKLPWDVVITAQGEKVRDLRSPSTAPTYVAQMLQIADATRRPIGQVYAAAPSAGPRSSALPANLQSPPLGRDGRPAANAVAQPPYDPRYADSRNQTGLLGAGQPIAQPISGPSQPPMGPPHASGNGYTNAPQLPPANMGVAKYPPAIPANSPAAAAPGFTDAAANGPQPAGTNSLSSSHMAPPNSNHVISPIAPPPADSPPMALDGCCPVHLSENLQWVPGSTQYGINHRGRTYLFAGPGCLEKFKADPERYAPVMAGHDPVLFVERGETILGRR